MFVSTLRYLIMSLPIHKCSSEEYYEKRESYINRQKAGIEGFNEFPEDVQKSFIPSWVRNSKVMHPGYLNNIAGFLLIGHNGGNHLVGDIYLRRRHFQYDSWARPKNNKFTSQVNDQFLQYGEVSGINPLNYADNDIIIQDMEGIIRSTRKRIRKLGSLRKAEVWLPQYGLSFADYKKIIKQLVDRKEETKL